MKAITLTQPWASLVAIGAKKWETRSWATNYRGPLAIHAAKGWPRWAQDSMEHRYFRTVLHEAFQGYERDRVDGARGHIIAIVQLVGCWPTEAVMLAKKLTDQEAAFGDYSPNRFAWRLDDVEGLGQPIPATGHLGLWDWDEIGALNDGLFHQVINARVAL